MGGQNGNSKQELSDRQIIEKLKTILQCLESGADAALRKQTEVEGNELYRVRKEQLIPPSEKRKEEIKLLLAEKMKENDNRNQGPPETVIKNIYPTPNEESKKDMKQPEECIKPPENNRGISYNGYPSHMDIENMKQGLLQGPYMDPFVVEFRMGEVIVGCQCTKRNGLQGDCKRWLCGGRKPCLQLPLPLCMPGGYGKIKPKPVKIFLNESSSQSCNTKENIPAPVKIVELPKKRPRMKLDYINCPPVQPKVKCDQHIKGRYYLRPLRKNEITQTEFSDNEITLSIEPVREKLEQTTKIAQPNTAQYKSIKKGLNTGYYCPKINP